MDISFTLNNRMIQIRGNDDCKAIVFLQDEKPSLSSFYDVWLSSHPVLLVYIPVLDWFHDLSPWKGASPFKKGEFFPGGGKDYLTFLMKQLIPGMEKNLPLKKAAKRILAGYSLAGLYSLFVGCESDYFSGIVSASGSLWYPGFMDYLKSHPLQAEDIYLSLGDRESRTKNPVLSKNMDFQREAYDLFVKEGKHTILEVNPGNHFVDDEKRLLKGFDWITK